MAIRSAIGGLAKGVLLGSVGMYAAAEAVRQVDYRRSKAEARSFPSLPRGEGREDIRSQDGTPLYVDYCGEGPTVFLVHGLACNNTIWRYQKAFLSENYRVVAPDLRGHGKSGVPESRDHSTERLAEDLQAVLEAFDPQEFVIVGHSMGGFTTFKWYERFGENYRGRLKGIVFVDSSGVDVAEGIVMGNLVKRFYPDPLAKVLTYWKEDNRLAQKIMDIYGKSALGYLFARYVAFGKRPPAEEVEFQRELMFATRLPCFALASKACLDYHMDPASLSSMDVPVLILVGSEDRLTAQRSSERTCEMLPRARLKVYEGRGHDTMLECPEEVNREIGGFLKECFA